MLSRGKLPHALLFVGPEGVGKSDLARCLAQVVMCAERQAREASACDLCSGCQKVRGEIHPDLHLVRTDGRALKVDDIREASRALHLRPFEGPAKFLIVQDADKMTIEAQNALLKTLEEPPGAAHIVLTTSRFRALLPTVISRCQRVPFRPIAIEDIVAALGTRKSIPEGKAHLIAAMSNGSLARALAIDPEELIERRDKVASLDLRLGPGRTNGVYDALELSTDLGEERADFHATLDLLMAWLHDQVLVATGATPAAIASADRRSDLEAVAAERGLRTILERADAVLHAKRQLELPFNLNQQMIAEELCLELAGYSTGRRSAEA